LTTLIENEELKTWVDCNCKNQGKQKNQDKIVVQTIAQ